MNEIEKSRYEVIEIAPGSFRVWDTQTDYYATAQICASREQAEAAMAGCLWYRVR